MKEKYFSKCISVYIIEVLLLIAVPFTFDGAKFLFGKISRNLT